MHDGRVKAGAEVNNAGYLRDTTFARMQEKDWADILAIHMTAVFRLCKAVWPIMMNQAGGRIINVCSTSGLYGAPCVPGAIPSNRSSQAPLKTRTEHTTQLLQER